MALVLAVGTVVVGTRLVLGMHAGVALPCSPRLCYRGFEEPWVQVLLAFNVAFLAALFLVQAWRASRSSGEDDSLADWVFASGGGGPPFLPLTLKSIILGTRSTVGALPPRTGTDKHHVMSAYCDEEGSLQRSGIPTSPARFAGSSYGQHSEGSLGATLAPLGERSFERTSPSTSPWLGTPLGCPFRQPPTDSLGPPSGQ